MNVSRKALSLLLSITLLASTVVSTGAFAATGDGAAAAANAATQQANEEESDTKNLEEAKTALGSALESAQEQHPNTNPEKTKYTVDSWAAFQSALATAKEIMEKTDAQVTEINEGYADLESAIAGLGGAVSARENLATAIEQASGYKETDYSDNSCWSAFKTALATANEVKDSKNGTTVIAITEAIDALKSATDMLSEEVKARGDLATAIEQADQFVAQHSENDYTYGSWNAFQSALDTAKEIQGNKNASALAMSNAASALATAMKNLVKKHDSGPSVNPSEPVAPTDSTFVSDTTYNFGVSGRYTFKITSKNGKAPGFVVGTPGVFDVQLVKQIGDDYYYKITAVGAPGTQAGIYINGGPRLLIATVQTNPTYVKSDTTAPFKVKAGKSYVFKLTADVKPVFFAGTGSAFKVAFVKQSGRDYFFRVTAVGKAGQASGFYINYHNAPVAVATIS